jgi:hypothetical protein
MEIVNQMTLALRERMKHRPGKNPGVTYKPTVVTPTAYRPSSTSVAAAAAQFPDTVGTTEQLHQIILDRLDGPKRRVWKPLLEAYSESMAGEALAAAAGYAHPMSKGYTNPRSSLRSFGLIEYPSSGVVKAADILFLDN